MLVVLTGLFVMAASCYLLYITSEPLEDVGGRIGRLLRLPEDVIASTFQAAATSGPEIVMAILAATSFIAAHSSWDVLTVGERGCSGCLNMCFSAMSNLLGIGCLGMIFMMWKKFVRGDEVVVVAPSVKVGLLFYVVSSGFLSLAIQLNSFPMVTPDGREIIAHALEVWQAWVLMAIGVAFVVSQFFVPGMMQRRHERRVAAGLEIPLPQDGNGDEDGPQQELPPPSNFFPWTGHLISNSAIYAFLVFALVIFVRECLGATFNIATLGFVSIGGVLIMFTSYVSSFPEFMMTYRYAVANKKSALLGRLFGSNVIDLAFAGFRAIRLDEPMEIYTTGRMQHLFPLYIWCLPALALISLVALSNGWFKYKHAYPLVVLYVVYVVSGFILL